MCSAEVKCRADDFKCGGTSPELCIRKEKRCDGYLDCRNGKDEENCPFQLTPPCTLDQFRCNSTQQCIDESLRCNYKDDCGDSSDEKGCSKFNLSHQSYNIIKTFDFTELIIYYCFYFFFFLTFADFPPCNSEQIRCANSFCVPKGYPCDNYGSCQDPNDKSCRVTMCPGDKFMCPKGAGNKPLCIERTQLCDGKQDCDDGADEDTTCCVYNIIIIIQKEN